ncbi:MAG: DUF427 domain-containing protein [Actinomycetia bacterium]|nr:DUF427 domain-containing protein [Actinomycetes bacterium]
MSDSTPAAEGIEPGHFPASPVAAGHVAPCPRRIRGVLDGHTLVDTQHAWYGWEHPYYPQYLFPEAGVDTARFSPTGQTTTNALGRFDTFDLDSSDGKQAGAASRLVEPAGDLPARVWRIEWSALDVWFEESERVFGHPRSPYSRVDAIRSDRHVEVRAGGRVIAEADSVVIVFETGLPPRHYFDPTCVNWAALEPTDSQTVCPYKGVTSGYWCLADDPEGRDIAWSYGFPTPHLQPVAGLVAFYDEVDIIDPGATKAGAP